MEGGPAGRRPETKWRKQLALGTNLSCRPAMEREPQNKTTWTRASASVDGILFLVVLHAVALIRRLPVFFLERKRGLEGPRSCFILNLSVHFYKKASERDKITHKPCKSAEMTLDLKLKSDPVLELDLRFRRGRRRRPPHIRQRRRRAGGRNSGRGALHRWFRTGRQIKPP
jgi:hypothetical protein